MRIAKIVAQRLPSRRHAAIGIALALGWAGYAAAAAAQTFGAPVALSLHGHAANVALGIDAAGNALATWSDEGMYFATRPAGGSWSTPQSFYLGGGFPLLQTDTAGNATLVSYSSGYGIWSVDRPAGGSWSSPTLIVNTPDLVTPSRTDVAAVLFLANPTGDQAIVFEQYITGSGYAITAVRRPAGGSWGALDTVATSAIYGDISLSGAAFGGNGDLLVTFEPFTVVCAVRYCNEINFTVHASREPSGTTSWFDSGALTPASSAYYTRAVMDTAGRAGVLLQNGFSATVQATTQVKQGAKWLPLATAYSGGASGGAQMWGAEASTNGQASLALIGLGTGGASALVLDGKLATNKWPTLSTLSTGDSPGANNNMAFGANAAGGSVVEWTDLDGTVRAAFRKKATAAWSKPQMIIAGSSCNIGGLTCTAAVAGAINAAGHAVIGYLRADPNDTVTTLYVATE